MKNGYFHIEIMISAAHLLGAMLPSKKVSKKYATCNVLLGVYIIMIKFFIKFFLRDLFVGKEYDIIMLMDV